MNCNKMDTTSWFCSIHRARFEPENYRPWSSDHPRRIRSSGDRFPRTFPVCLRSPEKLIRTLSHLEYLSRHNIHLVKIHFRGKLQYFCILHLNLFYFGDKSDNIETSFRTSFLKLIDMPIAKLVSQFITGFEFYHKIEKIH